MEANLENDRNHQDYTGKGHGPQGVDKAPGEEEASRPGQFIQQTQKGKNQVDGDMSKESDRPLERQDI